MSRNTLSGDRVGGGAEHVCDVVEVGGAASESFTERLAVSEDGYGPVMLLSDRYPLQCHLQGSILLVVAACEGCPLDKECM